LNQYQTYIALSRYAKWIEDDNRREHWNETCSRYVEFWKSRFPNMLTDEVYNSIVNLDVMPSMRCMMTAGKALSRDETAGYNCAYIAIKDQRAFDETMYILMCGTGVGFSCERQYINQLPEIPERIYPSDTTIIVPDSKIGWSTSLRELISLLYSGKRPKWDLSRVRPAGSRLRTFGGRASGPEPLQRLFVFVVDIFMKAQGRKLKSIEVHDIICKIGEVVLCGGVRRSALISLSNLSDDRMRAAKSGAWWESNNQRALANNSVAYTELPEIGIFIREWLSLYESKSGERGIFNRQAADKYIPERRKRFDYHDWGCNPLKIAA
jgi:ribonucleoside-diphosphate reductase alpha chain